MLYQLSYTRMVPDCSGGRARRYACDMLPRALLCRIFGHRLSRRRRPFFLTDRFQRCSRCGERVALRDD